MEGRFQGRVLVEGKAVLPDGRTYCGTFHAGTGAPLPGCTLEEDGDFYQGDFNHKWQRHGEGVALLADGTKYAGQFQDDELVHGIVKVQDGAGEITFTGQLRDESFTTGKLEHPDYVYVGAFESNQPHGKGELKFTSGAEQIGTFFKGQLHGSGKMRLESGHVYTGEFMNGRVVSGELRTPTYTYEGEFNEQGMAEGEGRAEYLTMHPRIIFTGLWKAGAMVQGVCEDEYGAPLDYTNRPDLKQAVGGTPQEIINDAAARTKLDDNFRRFRDMNESFARDVAETKQRTGVLKDKVDLGYEHDVASGLDALYTEQARAAGSTSSGANSDMDNGQSLARERANLLSEHPDLVEGIDPVEASNQAAKQNGYQRVVAQNADEQFARFLSSTNRGSNDKLEIDGNAPWRKMTK